MFKIIGKGEPIRLFVGGLHGREHETTDPIIEKFYERVQKDRPSGRLILRSFGGEEPEYLSTLEEDYYETSTGRKLLSTIRAYRPSINLELHSYSHYSKLTDPERMEKEGVPPLVDLGSGVLAGSVSPILRVKFGRNDSCFLLEVPNENIENKVVLDLMATIARSSERWEIVKKLMENYPKQTNKMIQHYLEFYGIERPPNLWPNDL